ncbi:MAG: sugar phosphate isomerase/epimerase [Clostridia bacterium]|nr:sugar phosphate isomerase/epimerase [Clostridia bacterium]
MLKLGTTLFSEKETDFVSAVKSAAKAGFKYVDFDLTHDYGETFSAEEKELKRRLNILKDNGMSVSQAHSPFIVISKDPNDFMGEKFLESVKKSIRLSAIIGAPYLVQHLYVPYKINCESVPYVYSDMAEDNFKRNVEFCQKLKPVLKENGVIMALENLAAYDWVGRCHASTVCCTSKECNSYINALGDKNFCICLDAGHLNLLAGEGFDEFISALNGRVKVLHLHDNFGILNDWFGELDRHLPPFVGCLEWGKLAAALKKNGFDGVYSFEVKGYAPIEFIDTEYKYIYDAGCKIFG